MFIQQFPFRLFVLQGCPHCEKAAEYITRSGYSWEGIVCNSDPIIAKGVEAMYGHAQFPILIAFPTQEIVLGFTEEKYAAAIKSVLDRVSAGPANGNPAGGQDPSPPPSVASPQGVMGEGAN